MEELRHTRDEVSWDMFADDIVLVNKTRT